MSDQIGGTVFVGVDGSPNANAAVAWAEKLAGRLGADVCALAVVIQPPPGETIEPAAWKRSYTDVIEKALGEADLRHIPLSVIEGAPAEGLKRATGGPGVSMLVVGTRGLGVAAGLLLGSVSRRLLFSVQRPLVLVPTRAAPLDDHPRVIVAIDGAPVGNRVLRWASELCAAIDGSARVLRCSEPGAERPAGYVAEYNQRVLKRMDEQAAEFRSRGVDYTLNVSNDDARAVILDTAVKEHASLIVIGKHGEGQFQGIGGTASYLVRHSPVPLAVVP